MTTLTTIVPGSPATNSDIDNSTLSSDHENEVSIFFYLLPISYRLWQSRCIRFLSLKGRKIQINKILLS